MASFTSVMGIVALGLDWRAVSAATGASTVAPNIIVVIGAVVFVALLIRWLQRVRSHREEVVTEMRGTVSSAYAGTISICLSLLALALAPYSYVLGFTLWVSGTVISTLLLLYFVGRWITHGIEPADITPALLLPIVGNAASAFGAGFLGVTEIAWFPFSFALVCWLVLLPLSMYRLFAVQPRLPRKAAPQMGVLISSPAVFAAAWSILHHGAVDDVTKILAFKSLFLALLMLRMIRHLWGEPFSVASWGWGFPVAALAGILIHIAGIEPAWPYICLAGLSLAVATIIIAGCSIAAIRGWFAPRVIPSAVEGHP
jgi:tellurite resistance protein